MDNIRFAVLKLLLENSSYVDANELLRDAVLIMYFLETGKRLNNA